MESPIDKVRNRKRHSALLIDGINYGRVIAMQTYNTSFKSLIKELVRLFCFNYTINSKDNMGNVFLFFSLKSSGRSDYNEIVHLFEKAVGNVKKVELIQVKSFSKLLNKIIILIKNIILFKSSNVSDYVNVAIVVTQYFILKNSIDEILQFNNLSLVVTFCDAHGPDNLIAQIAKSKGITTVTLQHGQYRVLTKGNEIADAEAYENLISDYLLTWGQATVDEFLKAGIDRNRMIKVGALKSFSFNKKLHNHKNTNVFGIVLSGESYKETNIAMINFANSISERYGLMYFLRMHPRNNKNIYMQHCKSKYLFGSSSNIGDIEYAQKVDFSLIHMTGVFVELLSINSPIIIYKDSLLERIFEIGSYCLSTIEEFDLFYKKFRVDKNKILDEQYNYYKYFNEPENVLENYKAAIEYIVRNKNKGLSNL